MRLSTITSKGQITIPIELRKEMGLREGDKVEFVLESGQAVMRPVKTDNPFAKYRGMLASSLPKTLKGILREERARRGRFA